MYFYRHHPWGVGLRIFLVFLLIFGGIAIVRSSMQIAYLRGMTAEGAEITGPMFVHPGKWGAPVAGPFGLTPGWILVIFLGGILLIKLIKSIIGLILFNRWKKEGGWESIKDWHHAPYHPCPPYSPHGGWWRGYHRRGYPKHPPHPDSPDPESQAPDSEDQQAA